MNKAFIREPDDDGRRYCPKCGSLGTFVRSAPLETHILPEFRGRLGDSAWFCGYPPCEVAYFDPLGGLIRTAELRGPVYPKSDEAAICPCFDFTVADVELDAEAELPLRIRELVVRSQSEAARCGSLAADGQCCLTAVRRLYLKLKQNS